MYTALSTMRGNAAGWIDMDATIDFPGTRPSPPLWLLAELTYRCPLHCAFCYNPVDFASHGAELDTDTWRDVITQARRMGARSIHTACGSTRDRVLVPRRRA